MIFKHFFQQSLQFCCKWALIYASKIYSSDLFFNYRLFSQFGRKNLGVKTTFFLRNMVRNMVFRNMVKFFILDIYVIRAAFSDRATEPVCFLSRLEKKMDTGHIQIGMVHRKEYFWVPQAQIGARRSLTGPPDPEGWGCI